MSHSAVETLYRVLNTIIWTSFLEDLCRKFSVQVIDNFDVFGIFKGVYVITSLESLLDVDELCMKTENFS